MPTATTQTDDVTWLVFCPGRQTQTSIHATRAGAEAAAARLSQEWPGHIFTVYQAIATHTAARPPRRPSAPPGAEFF